jgi:glycosyltransferase involved in cell wall biosynthesis
MKIDVCIVTRSAEAVNHIVKKFKNSDFVNKIIIETSKPLGLARMKAISKVSTEWFAFIDDDIVIQDADKWITDVTSYITPEVGALEGTDLVVGLGKKWDSAINRYRMSLTKTPVKLDNGKWARGYTTNTLIRTAIVKDWKPSDESLEAFEDLELTKHIQEQGYDWLKVPVVVFHVKTWRGLYKNALWQGRTLNYSTLYTKREKVSNITQNMIHLLRCTIDPRLNLSSKVRLLIGSELFLEIFSFLFTDLTKTI